MGGGRLADGDDDDDADDANGDANEGDQGNNGNGNEQYGAEAVLGRRRTSMVVAISPQR